jgi:hypothetical protein
MKNKLSDSQLDNLLRRYTAPVQVTETAIETMVWQARVRAVKARGEVEQPGFYGLVARMLGFSRLKAAAWSGAAGMVLALMIGITAGFAGAVPGLDETGYALDFDNVLGTTTVAASTDFTL